MARLLTLLLLDQSGYGVGRYIGLERLVNDAREGYYEALQAAGRGWHEDAHDIWPWLEYLLILLLAALLLDACKEEERKPGLPPGARTTVIQAAERTMAAGPARIEATFQERPGPLVGTRRIAIE